MEIQFVCVLCEFLATLILCSCLMVLTFYLNFGTYLGNDQISPFSLIKDIWNECSSHVFWYYMCFYQFFLLLQGYSHHRCQHHWRWSTHSPYQDQEFNFRHFLWSCCYLRSHRCHHSCWNSCSEWIKFLLRILNIVMLYIIWWSNPMTYANNIF